MKRFTEWPDHYNSILSNKQDSNLRKYNPDDRERNDNKLIEMADRKGEETHSSESINDTSSYGNQLSSNQDGSSDNDDTSEDED